MEIRYRLSQYRQKLLRVINHADSLQHGEKENSRVNETEEVSSSSSDGGTSRQAANDSKAQLKNKKRPILDYGDDSETIESGRVPDSPVKLINDNKELRLPFEEIFRCFEKILFKFW